MELVIPGLIIIAILWFLARATRTRTEFAIELDGRELDVRHGQVPGSFLREARAILDDTPGKGTVSGVKRGERIALEFSEDVPKVLHQRLRNVWGLTHP